MNTLAAPRWKPGLRRSIGARLVGLFLLFAVAVTAIFLGGMQSAMRGSWQGYAQPLVMHYAELLALDIGTPPDLARAQALADRLPLRIRIDGPVLHWDSEQASDSNDGDRRRGDRPERPERPHRAGSPWHPTVTLADGHRIAFTLADIDHPDRPRHIGWATLAVLLLLTLATYAYVRHLLRPLADIRAGALRYGAGDFSLPIATRRKDELGQLAGQIDTMAAQLHQMLDAKRALLLAISHELRSPLTRARLNAELVADGPERDALLRDLGEMRDLVSDLLESERLASGHAALQREPTDLNDLLRELLSQGASGPEIRAELAPQLPLLSLDRARLRLLLRNLLGNAWRHGADAARAPQLRTEREGDQVRLVVRDFGPGVPDEQLARLGEAFYRPDSARQRATGGVGLGLYLCRLVAQAHGGTLSLRNAQPGLEAVVTLPVAAG